LKKPCDEKSMGEENQYALTSVITGGCCKKDTKNPDYEALG